MQFSFILGFGSLFSQILTENTQKILLKYRKLEGKKKKHLRITKSNTKNIVGRVTFERLAGNTVGK